MVVYIIGVVITLALLPFFTTSLHFLFHSLASKLDTFLPNAFCSLGTVLAIIFLAISASPNKTVCSDGVCVCVCVCVYEVWFEEINVCRKTLERLYKELLNVLFSFEIAYILTQVTDKRVTVN